jgi:hypothetical protein
MEWEGPSVLASRDHKEKAMKRYNINAVSQQTILMNATFSY